MKFFFSFNINKKIKSRSKKTITLIKTISKEKYWLYQKLIIDN